jgi:hypothetical protein
MWSCLALEKLFMVVRRLLDSRLFQRLVKLHGYSAIAIESSFPRHVSLTSISPGAVQPHMRLFRTQDLAMDLAGSKLIENL